MATPEPLFQRSEYGGHWMFTLGWDRFGLRITRGRLDRKGRYHEHQPDVFLLWRDRRIG